MQKPDDETQANNSRSYLTRTEKECFFRRRKRCGESSLVRVAIISCIVLVLCISAAFGLGRLSVLVSKKEPIVIEGYYPAEATSTETAAKISASPTLSTPPTPVPAENATYVASKNGKSYYFPWCGTVNRIKPENLIYFNSKTEAEKAGYSPGNCPGLKGLK